MDLTDLALRQILCPQVQELKRSPSLRVAAHPVGDLQLWGDTSTGTFRPFVPEGLRRQVFEQLHNIAHPGRRASRRLISCRFVWRGLAADVCRWAKECLACQRAKVHRHVHVRPLHIPIPARRFSHVHVDLVGPLPPSQGFNYLFTAIDRTTRWAEAIPLGSITAADCAQALLQGWVSRFGVPAAVTSDRGTQFTSEVWAELCTLLGVQHRQTTAYHPEANGMVERFHRRLKDALRARCAAPDWVAHLPWVMLGLRAAPREEDAISPAQAVFGTPIILPGQLLNPSEMQLTEFLSKTAKTLGAAKNTVARHNTASQRAAPPTIPDDLAAAPMVLVRRDGHVPPLAALYDGPYRVLRRSQQTFTILMGEREEMVSTSRLKACADPAAGPADPPRRGRPPGRRVVEFRLRPAPAAPPSSPPSPDRPPPVSILRASRATPAADRRGTVFPHAPRVFARSPADRPHPPSTEARPARQRRPPARLDL